MSDGYERGRTNPPGNERASDSEEEQSVCAIHRLRRVATDHS